MELEEVYGIIDKYLQSESHLPILIDVTKISDMNLLIQRYKVDTKNSFISACDYCKNDNLPLMPNLKNAISISESNVFLCNFSTYLKLLGKKELQLQIMSLLTDTVLKGKLILLTDNCRAYLDLSDKRLVDSKRIVFLGQDVPAKKMKIYLVSSKLPFCFDNLELYSDGICQLSLYVERMESLDTIFVKTSFTKEHFQNALLDVREVASSYDVIVSLSIQLRGIEKKLGTEEQWSELLKRLQDIEFEWIELIRKLFTSEVALASIIYRIFEYNEIDRWIYFIALKSFGVKDNDYLSRVIIESNSLEEFLSQLYDLILTFDTDDCLLTELYQQRKALLHNFPENNTELISFCKKVTEKGELSLYYLTDNTKLEREMIIKQIGLFDNQYGRKVTEQLLATNYPALFSYLSPYNYGNKYNQYFDLYKYSKITNQIDENLMDLVNKQIQSKDFLMEPTRAFLVDKINKNNSFLYFMDGMGIEFLSYIQHLCFKLKLDFSAQIGRCNLPSITAFNKEFIEEFSEFVNLKDLDSLKHERVLDYNYEYVKEPIHIAEELSILKKVIEKIDTQLQQGSLEKVVLISDHGASRMAVIAESVNKWEMSEKGKHSGRCCKISEIDEKPTCSVDENGFWSLLNYDRFQGSRKADVEVHGGALLEEVLVPIIEITKQNQALDCYILDDFKVVTASYRKVARIKIFISKSLSDVCILVDNLHYYNATNEDKGYIYEVEMPDINKVGIHTLDILVGSRIISKNLSFELKKEGVKERKFF